MSNRPVSFLESVNNFVQPGITPQDTVIESYCRQLQESHIRLGVLVADGSGSEESNRWLREAMNTIANLYYDLNAIREEVVEAYTSPEDNEDKGEA